jgi:hypothetical protein
VRCLINRTARLRANNLALITREHIVHSGARPRVKVELPAACDPLNGHVAQRERNIYGTHLRLAKGPQKVSALPFPHDPRLAVRFDQNMRVAIRRNLKGSPR